MIDLPALRSLLAAASMRPWVARPWALADGKYIVCERDGEFVGQTERGHDADLIVAAVNALPALLRLAAAAEAYRAAFLTINSADAERQELFEAVADLARSGK
jgi:hypothetical protein